MGDPTWRIKVRTSQSKPRCRRRAVPTGSSGVSPWEEGTQQEGTARAVVDRSPERCAQGARPCCRPPRRPCPSLALQRAVRGPLLPSHS